MIHLKRSRLLQVAGLLLLLAGLSLWPQTSSSSAALARSKPKPTPSPTASATPAPTATPAGSATPTPTPVPVNGSWQVVPSPAIDVSNSTFGARLNAVAVVSATDVWAVGFGPQPGGPAYVKQTLIEHWDGSQWSIVPSPNPPLSTYAQVELDSVFALATNDVWAVGYGEDPSATVSPADITLVEHWDGAGWSIVSSPNPDQEVNQLHAIVGVASNDLWAVGQRGEGGTACCPYESLIERWNGTSWSVVTNPGQTALHGITALAANDVWAVGTPAAGGGDIIEHWDGTAWSNVAAPIANANGGGISLFAVTAATATDIWAVGDQENPLIGEGGTYDSVTEHWDGSAWTVVGLALQDSVLRGVVATGPANAWAVDGSGLMRTQHWDGATWSVVSAPNPGTGSGLQGVAAVSAGDIWAVGWTNTNGAYTPLIEHFTQA